MKQLPALLRNPAVKLLCLHRSGRTIHNGPKAPVTPTMSLMTSTEECTFVRAVSESPTAQEAVARWSPTTTPPKKLKRLNTKPAQAPKKQTSPRDGSRGGFRGKKRGRGGFRGGHGNRGRGGYPGGRGGFGGYRGPSRGPTIVQSGIHTTTLGSVYPDSIFSKSSNFLKSAKGFFFSSLNLQKNFHEGLDIRVIVIFNFHVKSRGINS